ncbi:limonene-1,2-epoxide hydrolase family protein [Rhizobium sp. SGZ-381]|uniref:limonene-1,2-epoxide hydrolase family protein n=1 Tax=Rhizobium sp. SGZ-381 TaxID=3342800 RepID=UPI00367002A4
MSWRCGVPWSFSNPGNAASGNVVLNERIDIFLHENGGRITRPVMGTVTVENGTITVWRDYFDLADFDRQLNQIGK